MKKGEKSTRRGFTIIEVSLVIAIAGLIFLMVFVALPGLRASQRDTERREHMTNFLTQVKKYQTNNRGTLPGSSNTSYPVQVAWSESLSGTNTSWAGFYRDYLGGDFVDPDGENYKIKVVKCGVNPDVKCSADGSDLTNTFFPNDYTMVVVLQSSCNGGETVGTSNPRKLSVLYVMEGGGVYCANT